MNFILGFFRLNNFSLQHHNLRKRKSISFSFTSATVSIMPSNFIHGKTLFESIQLTLFFEICFKRVWLCVFFFVFFFCCNRSKFWRVRGSNAQNLQFWSVWLLLSVNLLRKFLRIEIDAQTISNRLITAITAAYCTLFLARTIRCTWFLFNRSIDWMIIDCF